MNFCTLFLDKHIALIALNLYTHNILHLSIVNALYYCIYNVPHLCTYNILNFYTIIMLHSCIFHYYTACPCILCEMPSILGCSIFCEIYICFVYLKISYSSQYRYYSIFCAVYIPNPVYIMQYCPE